MMPRPSPQPMRPAPWPLLALTLAACSDSSRGPSADEIVALPQRYTVECLYIADFVELSGADISAAPRPVQVAALGIPGHVRCPDLPPGWTSDERGPRPPPQSTVVVRLKAALDKGKPVAIRVVRVAR